MVKQYYTVLKKFNSQKDYGVKIRPQYAKCLSMLKVGQKINQKDFAKEFGHEFTNKNTQKARDEAVYHAFMLGKKIGVVRVMSVTELGYSIPYADFIKQKTVKVKLKGVEDLLHHYVQPLSPEREFVKIIKDYLLDPENADQSDKSMKVVVNSIKSYFEKNDAPINFKYNVKVGHTTSEDREGSASLNLDELMQLFTVGNPTIVQKTALLCKFHRGLDTSTLIDRFNFEAWEQLVNCFDISDSEESHLYRSIENPTLEEIRETRNLCN